MEVNGRKVRATIWDTGFNLNEACNMQLDKNDSVHLQAVIIEVLMELFWVRSCPKEE